MPSGFNYSRWDKLELSDDEDTHPGAQFIEKNTLRRIKRESHEIHEQERKNKVAALQEAQAKGAPRRAFARRAQASDNCRRLALCAARRNRQMTKLTRSWSSRLRR